MNDLHVLHSCFLYGGKFRLSVWKSMNPLFDAALYRSISIHHTLNSHTKTRTTLFLLCTKSYIVWRKIGVWCSSRWKSVKRKSQKLLVVSRSFRLCYLKIGNLLLNRLHRGDWARQFYVSLYIPPKPVATAFFHLREVMYLYITYYISIRIWCQYWCQWCQTLSRHQIFQKCSARSVPSIPSVPPHRFPLSF